MKTIITNTTKLRVPMIKIKRSYHKDFTMGIGSCEGFNFVTLELPDKDNQKNISCIPAGRYIAKKRISPGKGYEVIEFIDVPNRTFIQLHRGNFTSQLLGCMLPGDGLKFLNDDAIIDITNSRKTLDELLSLLPDVFEILIE